MTKKFDFEQALKALQAGKPITGKDSVLSPLDGCHPLQGTG